MLFYLIPGEVGFEPTTGILEIPIITNLTTLLIISYIQTKI